MPEALWAYRTMVRGTTQETPFSLLYGDEAILPLEIQILSLQIAVYDQMTVEHSALVRLRELESLDEVQLTAKQNIKLYQARTAKAFNKMVRNRSFKQ